MLNMKYDYKKGRKSNVNVTLYSQVYNIILIAHACLYI